MTSPRCPYSDLPVVLCAHCRTGPGGPDAIVLPDRDTRKGRRADPEYRSELPEPPAPIRAGGGGTGNVCQACGSTPAGDAFICPGCHDQAERDLSEVPTLVEELTIHATGQSRFAGGADSGGLPYAEHAAQLLHDIVDLLAGAVAVLDLNHPRVPSAGGLSRVLLAHIDRLPLHPEGPAIAASLRRWHAATMQAIDAPPERVYLGLCECGTAIHAPQDAAEFQCRTCGTTHDTAVLRESLTDRLRAVVASVTELEIIAKQCGYKATRKQIEGMIRHGRLARVGRRVRPKRYRAGDLLALLEDDRQTRKGG